MTALEQASVNDISTNLRVLQLKRYYEGKLHSFLVHAPGK